MAPLKTPPPADDKTTPKRRQPAKQAKWARDAAKRSKRTHWDADAAQKRVRAIQKKKGR